MIELLRNVIQHSQDNNGAIILAQLMNKGENNKESFIQIAVVDCGMGIYKSLTNTRHEVLSNDMALERSIWPYYSGKFYAYQGGSSQNAGMGLFFVSEMAKLTAGKLLISSKESSLYIEGDPEAKGNNKIKLFETGFDGTLVAFEIPKRGVADYGALNKKIIEIARERKTKQESSNWIRFDFPPDGSMEFIINIASENTVEAEKFSQNELLPRIENRQIIVLNFVNMQICTQSYMHSLLFTAIKKAFELKVPIFARNASPSVADGIRLLEMYGL